MEMNVYALERHVAMLLDEARAQSARDALAASTGPRNLRAALGLGLIRLGRRLSRASAARRRGTRVPIPTPS